MADKLGDERTVEQQVRSNSGQKALETSQIRPPSNQVYGAAGGGGTRVFSAKGSDERTVQQQQHQQQPQGGYQNDTVEIGGKASLPSSTPIRGGGRNSGMGDGDPDTSIIRLTDKNEKEGSCACILL